MWNSGVFFFLAAASIGFFSFLIATHWIDARAAERRARDRSALLKKLADQPADSVQHLIELVREEDAREEERQLRRREKARREDLKGGVMLIASGAGVGIMLFNLETVKPIWMVGLIPAFIGVIVFGFAYFTETRRPAA